MSPAKLQAYSWDEGHDHEALLEALSMDVSIMKYEHQGDSGDGIIPKPEDCTELIVNGNAYVSVSFCSLNIYIRFCFVSHVTLIAVLVQ